MTSRAETRALVALVALLTIVALPAPGCGRHHKRQTIATKAAPDAIGPYSQAIRVGQTLYLSGQIAIDPATGAMVDGGVKAETEQVMMNIGAVLEAAGYGFEDVVQAQVFLANLDDYAVMNWVYATYFGESPPARAAVQAARLPRGARVEIMMTAKKVR